MASARTLAAMPMRTFSDIACMPVSKGKGPASVNRGEGDERLLWRRFVQRLYFRCSAPDRELQKTGQKAPALKRGMNDPFA
jgi:hypothetical protein